MPTPMNFQTSMQSTATSGADMNSAGSSASWGAGAWNINLGGTGTANFAANASAASSGLPPWVWPAAAVVLAWLILK